MDYMPRNGGVCWRRRSVKIDGFYDSSPPCDVAKKVHVLAVDDSFVDRKVIEKLLKTTACKVTAVDSGRKALQYLGLDEEQSGKELNGLKVDLIITDYCMPGMTGYELLKKIKESSTLREIPVVIMSSENVLARIDRCLEEGAEDFLVKPVQLSDVKRLKGYMTGEVKIGKGNKRKLPEVYDLSSPPSTSSSSPPSSPWISTLSPPTSLTPLISSTLSSLDFPVRRVKTSCRCD